jgi:hypothetical protein
MTPCAPIIPKSNSDAVAHATGQRLRLATKATEGVASRYATRGESCAAPGRDRPTAEGREQLQDAEAEPSQRDGKRRPAEEELAAAAHGHFKKLTAQE